VLSSAMNRPGEIFGRGRNADIPQAQVDTTTSSESLPVSLPKGSHGLQFQGQPAWLGRIRLLPGLSQDSRNARRTWLGKVVIKVEFPGLTVYKPSARILMYLLKSFEKTKRILYLLDESEVADRSTTEEETAGVAMSLVLRSVHWGPPGVYFSGDGSSPPEIANVTEDCLLYPLRHTFLGFEVERLVVPGRINLNCESMSGEELSETLRTFALFEKRILYLKSPSTDDDIVVEAVHLDEVGHYIDIQGVVMADDDDKDLRLDGNECVICMENCKEVVFDPCRHRCACQSCASKLRSCPICRRNIAKRLLTFSDCSA